MEPHPTRSSARLLAPISLIVCAFAVLIVIMGSAGGEDTPSAPPADQSSDRAARTTSTKVKTTPEKTTYTVETGDTLGGIAEDTGVSVETLLELNPALDPQALATGQKIKLVQ